MKKIIYLILIAFIIAIVLYLYPQFEWYKPEIKIDLESEYVGVNPFDIVITDSGKGLSSVIVILTSEDDDHILVDKSYPDGVNKDLITLKLDPNNFKMKDGPAKIIVKVEDKSRLKLFSGNKNEISKDITLDLTPPNLALVTDQLNLSHGGAGLIIYKINEESVESGVEVGDYYFKGYGGYFKDQNMYLSFIAYPYNIGTDEKLSLLAKDKAGNIRKLSIYYTLKNIDYKKSDIDVSDRFILNTMAHLSNIQNNGKYKEIFLDVNRNLRNDNDKKIVYHSVLENESIYIMFIKYKINGPTEDIINDIMMYNDYLVKYSWINDSSILTNDPWNKENWTLDDVSDSCVYYEKQRKQLVNIYIKLFK